MKLLAIDIGGTYIKYAVMTETLELLHKAKIETIGKESVYQKIDQLIYELIPMGIKKIGIGTAGVVDVEQKLVVKANENIPGYAGTDFKKLEEKYGIELCVDNDVNAVANYQIYKLKNEQSYAMICLGTGIGGALIFQGKLYRGSSFQAGEIGYMMASTGGEYEKRASTLALVRKARTVYNKEDLTGEELFYYVYNEDERAIELIHSWAKEVVIGFTNLIYLLNISKIYIGGGVSSQKVYLEPLFQEQLEEVLHPNFRNTCQIEFLEEENDMGLYGAIAPYLIRI